MPPTPYEVIKRALDISLSLVLIFIFFPIWIVIPPLIIIDSVLDFIRKYQRRYHHFPKIAQLMNYKGSVIYQHRRIGKGGRPFIMYKFRSMIEDADDYLYKKNPELLKQFKDSDWKLAKDPRITSLGRILRALTIDEFPQLINVLKGDMSLVGPRAYVEQELKEQPQKYPQTKNLISDILSVKPGITGPWQTSGRNEIPFDKRAELDAQYARKKSLINDVSILVKTPKAMLSKW